MKTAADAVPLTPQPSTRTAWPEEGASGRPGPSDLQATRPGAGSGVRTEARCFLPATPPGDKASFPDSRFISLQRLALQLSPLTPFMRN